MSSENGQQSEAQPPVASHRKTVAKPLNLSQRAEETKSAEQASKQRQEKVQKLVPRPQPLPDNQSVPQHDVLNEDQT